ncbi:beta-alanine-activating enzyme isoform X4 [Lagopus muta]|uniref:beta-alanine-activating enzyme isoform X4 n=1 Tax=Lagopus muta TaxID=64668 RepID=UPI0020A16493|nr:beta-alanine-activating enzyme isoform X4 [Lagopus muta]
MTLHDMVAQAASLHSGRKAVWFDECNDGPPTFYTYATVIKHAMELTAFLQKYCDPQGRCEIGLYCSPGINLPSWILGILQVPAAYCPIDPDAPPLLSTYFMRKSNLQYILVENDKVKQFQTSHVGWLSHNSSTIESIGLTLFQMSWSSTDVDLQADSVKSKFEAFKVVDNSQLGALCPEHLKIKTSEGRHKDVGQKCSLAYILHTSGTTGTPKVVRVPHACIVPNIQHLKTDFPVPLGSPLLGTTVEIRDANGSVVLEGEGQIFIGGEERICFLDDEIIVPQGTMRETGDFVRVQNAEIFFLGRKDNQIKRHGKRFNIECLQQAAEDLCQVEACAVTWYQQEKLILFVVPKGDLEEREILHELQKHLPAHGIPDELVQIKTLPLTSHGKVDISELNKIYHYHLRSRRRDSKLSGAEELWERLQYLWKSILDLLDDSSGIPKDAVFLHSGGDSLKALQFHDEIEMLVGRGVPGLLEVLLSRSIEEVYKHILKTLFPDEDQLINDDNVLKRKLSNNSGEEIHRKYAKLKSEGYLNVTPGLISFIALRRGNHFFSMDFTNSFMQPSSTVQVGGESVQQPSFLRAVTPSITKSHVQGHEKENRTLTITNKEEKTDCCSVQQICAECNHVTTAELALRTRWKSNTRKCVDASPLIVISSKDEESASVFVGSHSHTMQAIDLDTGEVKWEKNLGDRVESSACVSKCGNFIVVGCYDGLVYVLQSTDGETYWTFATEDAVKSSAVVDPSSGLVYVGSHDQHMYALDIYEKMCVWKLHCEGGAVFSSPCLSSFPHHVYVATLGGLLLAVNPVTGNKIWKSFLGKPLFSSPHCNEKCVCIGCVDGNLYCYSHCGEKVWQFSTNGPVFSSPCISSLTKQEVFFGSHDHFIYCCNTEGDLLWKFKATSSVYGTPFVFQRNDSKNKVLLAAVSTDGKVWILNARSGTAEGTDTLPGEVFSSPVVWGTKLVVGCRNDYVYCLDLYVTGKKEQGC